MEQSKIIDTLESIRGMPTLNKPKEFMPPSYVLRKTKDGEVYAKFVGPQNAFDSMLFGSLTPLRLT